jgi:hypothetical protein
VERLLSLTYLPVLVRAASFEILAEPSHLLGDRLVRGWSGEKSADPAHAVRGGLLVDQPRLEEELAELRL